MSKTSSLSAEGSGQRQTSSQGMTSPSSQGVWSVPTLDDYLKAEQTQKDQLFDVLGAYINTPHDYSSNTPPTQPARALGMIILNAILSRQTRLSEVLALQAEADPEIIALLDNFNPRDRKQCNLATKVLGSKAAILLGKTKRSTVLKECDRFVIDNIEALLTPDLTEFSISGASSVSPFSIIALTIEVLAESPAGVYILSRPKYDANRLHDKITEKKLSYCDLRSLSMPHMFELRNALQQVRESRIPAISACAIKLFEVFNPFASQGEENRMKLEHWSNVFLNPQLSRHLTKQSIQLRDEQKEWIFHMRDMYVSLAENIIADNGDPDAYQFNRLIANAAQMGAGKTSFVAGATQPLQSIANAMLESARLGLQAGVDGGRYRRQLVSVVVEPSLTVAMSFASKMANDARIWLIVNGTVVPTRECCPVVRTGHWKHPERKLKIGDFEDEHRDPALNGLTIMEQIEWFLSWQAPSSMKMKSSKSSFGMPTHIFCDPCSACDLYAYKKQLRMRGIYLVGFLDEIVACADCGKADPDSNPLAYYYAKLMTLVDVGMLLSASYDSSNFEYGPVLPSIKNAVSFTQLCLHDGSKVTPLNGLVDLDRVSRHRVIESWSVRTLRLFPPPLVPQITDMLQTPFASAPDDLVDSVSYLEMVRRLCFAVVDDAAADKICRRVDWKVQDTSTRSRDSRLNIYTGDPRDAALRVLGDDAITRKDVERERNNYVQTKQREIADLKLDKSAIQQSIKDRDGGNNGKLTGADIDERIKGIESTLSNPAEYEHTFSTRFGTSYIKGVDLDKLLRMSDNDVILALSGVSFDSLAFSPELQKICANITTRNSLCEFVNVGNVYGTHDATVRTVVVHGANPDNFGLESLCQTAGRGARVFDGRNQIAKMIIPRDLLSVFSKTTSIMDDFAANIAEVHRRATVRIQSTYRGYIDRVRIQVVRARIQAEHLGELRIRVRIATAAATCIQSTYRGYIARIISARKKHRLEKRVRQRLAAKQRPKASTKQDDEPAPPQTGDWQVARGRRKEQNHSVYTPPQTGGGSRWSRGDRRQDRQEPDRESGTIQNWMPRNSYGFIDRDGGGKRMFIHERNLEPGSTPRRGDRVSYIVTNVDGRNEATNLRIL
jgi:cold shock CspA family protein